MNAYPHTQNAEVISGSSHSQLHTAYSTTSCFCYSLFVPVSLKMLAEITDSHRKQEVHDSSLVRLHP